MKFAKKILALVCALVIALILCACGSSSTTSTSSTSIEWPSSGLATLLPEPSLSSEGEIAKLNQDSSSFSARITGVSSQDFEDYVNACQEKDFKIDIEEESDYFSAFNQDGYKVTLQYKSSSEYYTIDLDEPMYESGSTFYWPTEGLSQKIPEPESNIGEIIRDRSWRFDVYVGNTSIDKYNEYVDKCIEAGFDVDYSRSDKTFTSYDSEGYSIDVEYKGFNTIEIKLDAPDDAEVSEKHITEYESEEDTNNEVTTPDISEEVSESPALETSSEETSSANTVNEPNAGDDSLTETSEPDILTADNCSEFAEVLSCGDFSNQLYANFYDKYKGKTIEFDGCIVLVEDDKYNGYYDVMICPGDYNDSAFGPQFMFDGAAPSAFEEGNTGLDLPSYVKVGANVHVVATLSRYDDTAGLCYLNPKSVTER